MRFGLGTALLVCLGCSSTRESNSDSATQAGTSRSVDSARFIDSLFPKGWQVTESKSRMDDSKTLLLSLRADTSSEFDESRLIIRCSEGKTALYVTTEVAENDVQFRIDSARPRSEEWSRAKSGGALFAPSPIAFARQLATANHLLFRFNPVGGSPQDVDFNLAGLAEHLPKIADACDWSGARLPRTTDPKRLKRNLEAMLPWVRQYVVTENWSPDGPTSSVLMEVSEKSVVFNATRIAFDRIDSTRMQDGALVVVIKR